MYYCEKCAVTSNLPKTFFQTYRACDECGGFGIVYDNCQNYELPKDAPLFRFPIKAAFENFNKKASGKFNWIKVGSKRVYILKENLNADISVEVAH